MHGLKAHSHTVFEAVLTDIKKDIIIFTTSVFSVVAMHSVVSLAFHTGRPRPRPDHDPGGMISRFVSSHCSIDPNKPPQMSPSVISPP